HVLSGELFVIGEQGRFVPRDAPLADSCGVAEAERADVGAEHIADSAIEIPVQGVVQLVADNAVRRMPQGLRDLSGQARKVLVQESDLISHVPKGSNRRATLFCPEGPATRAADRGNSPSAPRKVP